MPRIAFVALIMLTGAFGCAQASETTSLTRSELRPWQAPRAKIAVTVEGNRYASYFIDLPSNVSGLTVRTTGSGEVDLFVRPAYPHDAATVQGLIDQSAGFSATPGGNETVSLQRGSSALRPGRWWLTVANTGSAPISIDLDAQTTTQGAAFVPAVGQSGTWYDPSKSLQGLFVQYLSAAQVFVAWFTYDPEGRQAYLFGVGNVVGDRIEVPNFNRTRGARFGAAFDPARIVSEDWGDLVITLDGCATGYADFLPSRAGWPVEQLRLQKLTSIPGLACGSGAASPSKYLGSSISGSWYDPERSGEGYLVQALSSELAVLYWFTFDPQGNQAWFGGVGQIIDGSIVVADATQPTGGRFGPGYSPTQVTTQPWGAIGMTLTSCSTAVLESAGPTAWGGFGSDGLQRLTGVAGVPNCNLGASPRRVSGRIQPAPMAFQDGDTNNPDNPNLDNDTAAQPQVVPTNPALISGFVTATPTGVAGDRFAAATDIFDGFRMTITAGQTLQLVISDWDAAAPTAVDLDLELYSTGANPQLLQSAMGTSRSEFLTVQQAGTYDVVVRAFAGRSNYVLVIGSSPAPAQAKALRIEDDFVVDDIVLRFDEPWLDDSAPKALYRSIRQRDAELGGLQFARGEPGRPQLWRLPATGREAVLASLGAATSLAKHADSTGWRMSPQQQRRHEHIAAIKALSTRTDVRYAEPNYIARTLAVTPNDPRYREQWHYPMINLPQAWDVTQGAANVVVAVIDTGVNPHPDLAANLRVDLGVDTILDPINACDGGSRDLDGSDPGDGCGTLAQDSFHGTHVAGTVAAINNNQRGGAGVAPLARVMPVRVLGRQGGTSVDIADGVRWAIGDALGTARASRAADVLNLSLGGSGPCPAQLAELFQVARSRGVAVVVAAGNSNSSATFQPADCPGVIKVSAVNRAYLPSHYSNCRDVDVAAPGGESYTDEQMRGEGLFAPQNASACKAPLGSRATFPDGVLSTLSQRGSATSERYSAYQGTSMAAPHVAGVIALMKAANPALTANDVDTLLAAGRMTFDPRSVGVTLPAAIQNNYAHFYGRGIIDALASVRAARELAGGGGAAPPAALVAQPTFLDFGDTTQTLTLTISRVGTGSLGIQSLGTTVPWLGGSGGGADGLGQYTLSANRSGLPAGEHTGLIRAVSTTGTNLDIPVRLRVGALPSAGQSGAIYALLLDALTLRTVTGSPALLPQSGSAAFQLASVLPGSYYLIYGTDNDNDQFICDAGEYCGFFPFSDNAGPFVLATADLDLGVTPLLPDLSAVGEADPSASKRLPPRVENAARRTGTADR